MKNNQRNGQRGQQRGGFNQRTHYQGGGSDFRGGSNEQGRYMQNRDQDRVSGNFGGGSYGDRDESSSWNNERGGRGERNRSYGEMSGRFNNDDDRSFGRGGSSRSYGEESGWGGSMSGGGGYGGFGNRSDYWSGSHVDYPGLYNRDSRPYEGRQTQGATEYGRWAEEDEDQNFALGDRYGRESEWTRNRGSYGQQDQQSQGWGRSSSGGGGQGMWGRGGPGEGTSGERRGEWENQNSGSSYAGGHSGLWGQSGQGETSRFRAPKGYTRSDERIREEVCDTLGRNGRVDPSEIEVQVKDGEVTLSGTIDRLQNKHQIETMVHSVSGVKDVTNNIRIKRESSESNRQESENGNTSRQKSQNVGTQNQSMRHS